MTAAAEPWWRLHPAYPALLETFRGHTASPGHLAFLTLTGLTRQGWAVVSAEPETAPREAT